VEDAHHDVPAEEFLAVAERRERKGHVGGLVQAVVRTGAGGEGAPPGSMVGLDVRLDHPSDLGTFERRELQVALQIVGVRVYDRRRLVAHSPENIGGTPGLGIQELLEDHRRFS
jgi:hypothetical protein